jgi:hypothetical protein
MMSVGSFAYGAIRRRKIAQVALVSTRASRENNKGTWLFAPVFVRERWRYRLQVAKL